MPFNHSIEHREEVNGIVYRVITESDIPAAIDFFYDVFLKDEPANMSFGDYDPRSFHMAQEMRQVLTDGVSIIAEDPANNNKMVGFRTGFTIERGNVPMKSKLEENLKIYPPPHAYILHLFNTLMYPGDVFENNPEINKIYDMFTLASHPDYRGRGIATELVNQALKVAKIAGCDCAIVLSTNDFSKKIFDRIGFEVLTQTDWKDITVDGVKIFVNVKSRSACSHILKF